MNLPPVEGTKELSGMSKPPKTTPHSDLDGVHEDERSNIDSANEAGQDASDLAHAQKHSVGRPPYSEDKKSRDDRAS